MKRLRLLLVAGCLAGYLCGCPPSEAPPPDDAPPAAAPDRALAPSYETYRNDRFGFSVRYPAGLLHPLPPPQNDDGRRFESDDGRVRMRVSGRHNATGEPMDALWQQARRAWAEEGTITYETQQDSAFIVSGTAADTVFYQKTLLRDGLVETLELRYPAAMKAAMDSTVSVIAQSFEG